MNIRQDTSRSNGDTSKKLVELFIILDSQGNVTGDDTTLLVIASSIARKFKNLGRQLLQHCGKVHWSTSTHARSVLSLTQVTADATDGELQAGLR